MNKVTGFKPLIKALLFWSIILLMYFAYKFFPVFPLSIFCAVNESNFQHYKATFFAFMFLNGIEYVVYRRQIQDLKSHCISRITAITFAPWVVFLLWYSAPAVYGKMPTIALEILYANMITFLVGYFVVSLEQGLAQIYYPNNLITVILILFVVSIGVYLIFTFKLPWADVFAEPAWR